MKLESTNQSSLSMGMVGDSLFLDVPGPEWFVAKITKSVAIKVQTSTGQYDAVAHAWEQQEPTNEGVKYQDASVGIDGTVESTASTSGIPPAMINPAFALTPSIQVADNTLVYMRKRGMYSFSYTITPTTGSGSTSSIPSVLYGASTDIFDIMTGTGSGSGAKVVTGVRCRDGVLTVAYGTV
jgi:hypothetical protein